MTPNPSHPAYSDPKNPYFGISHLYEQSPINGQITDVKFHPQTGKPIPFTTARDIEAMQNEFRNLPPHLQQEVLKINELQKQKMEEKKQADQGARLQETTPQMSPRDPTQHPKVETAAKNAGIKKCIAPPSSTTDLFEANKVQVKLETAFTPRNKYGVSMPISLQESTWQEVKELYTQYLEHKDHDFPKEGTSAQEAFFYKEKDQMFFEVKFKHENILYSSRVEVASKDVDHILKLQKQYPLLMKDSFQKIRTFRRVAIASDALPQKLIHKAPDYQIGESLHYRALFLETIEKSQKMAKTHSVDFVHPMTAEELSEDQIKNLIERAISRNGSFVTAEEESEYVGSLKASQNIFSKSPHPARVCYNIEPRSGNTPKVFEDSEAQHLAKLYPLHFSVNARLGELHGDDAHLVENMRSAIIHSKDRIFKDEYTTLIQGEIELPELNEEDLLKAIINQASKYHEIRQSFTAKSQKYISLRDPILGIGLADHQERDFKENIKLSIFIRIVALYFVNSRPNLNNPKLKLEFEYKSPEIKGELPEIADFVQEMRERINYALDTRVHTIKSLATQYLQGKLPLPSKIITPPITPDAKASIQPQVFSFDTESLSNADAFAIGGLDDEEL